MHLNKSLILHAKYVAVECIACLNILCKVSKQNGKNTKVLCLQKL